MPMYAIVLLIVLALIAFTLVVLIVSKNPSYREVEANLLSEEKASLEAKIILVQKNYPNNVKLLKSYQNRLQAVNNLIARLN